MTASAKAGSDASGVDGRDWSHAIALVGDADEVCLACHVSPDGDALGSMLALGLALRRAGRRVTASFGDDPFVVPASLRFLPGVERLSEPVDYPPVPDLMITFDASSPERLGVLTPMADKARELVVLDHHASNPRFGTVNIVDTRAPATALVVDEMIRRLGWPVTSDVATCLYTALVTDTGSFRFGSTSEAAHLLAARLIAAGVRPDAVARRLWDTAPFGYLQLLGTVLGRVRLEPDAISGLGLVWTVVTRADRAAYDLPFDLVEQIIDLVRLTDEAEVAVVVKEDNAGAWRVSTRSKGRVDVGEACTVLGGGGHPSAAGFSTREELGATIDRLRGLLTVAHCPV